MPFQFRGRRPDAGRELMQARRSCRGMPTPLVARLLAMVVLHQRSDSLRLSSVFYKAFSNCNSQARKETCLDRATSSSRGNWRSVYNERRYPNRIGPKISRIFAASEAGSQLSSPPKAARPLELWLDARGTDTSASLFLELQDMADVVLHDAHSPADETAMPPGNRSLFMKKDGKLVDIHGYLVGASVEIVNPKSQGKALSLVGSVDWIQVTCSDWTMIPAENLVSAASGTPTKIAVELIEPSQVQGAAFALQIGVDALLLRPTKDLWTAAIGVRHQRNDLAKQAQLSGVETGSEIGANCVAEDNSVVLSVGKVTRTVDGGVGDRVCVDLIQSLVAGEGMLVGSSAKLLALVHAETFETGFVPARPFRVNAGPVHSYVLLADGSTKYLSELRAGDKVLVVDWRGASRAVAIGRLKVETRPMIMIQFQGPNGNVGQLFLQQAETVRFISPTSTSSETDTGRGYTIDGWYPLPVTDVEEGHPLFLREISRGTHVGKAIDATVTES